jgi:hypothetical protein
MAATTDQDSLQSVLLGDVAWVLSLEPRDGVIRRVALRSILAAVEGILGELHRGLLSTAELELHGPERAFLRNETRLLTGNGVGNVSHELRLRQRVERTATLLTRLRPQCKVDFNAAGWRELRSSLDLGDRLKHAQDKLDLDVTRAELAAAVNGYTWLLDNLVAVAQSAFQGDRQGAGAPHSTTRPEQMPQGSARDAVDSQNHGCAAPVALSATRPG